MVVFKSQQGTYYGKISILKVINIFLHLGKKVFTLEKDPIRSDYKKRFGSGIYEGQTNKEGYACGQGKWKCTDPFDDCWYNKGTTIEGSFKDDLPHGFGKHLQFHYALF